MVIHITAGQCLNTILQEKYPLDYFIPFNEAMIEGSYSERLFSDEFCIERANVHHASIQDYKEIMKDFLSFLKRINEYSRVVLWFGDEPFCKKNVEVLMDTLKLYQYKGEIYLHIVNEEDGTIILSKPMYLDRDIREKIYNYLISIPKGKVVTYGQIGEYLGNKKLARVIGNILHVNPDGIHYPCFKVVSSKGKLAKHFGALGGLEEQKRRLEEDGIAVQGEYVDLDIYQWVE